MFTCVIDIQNANINAVNISWWRKIFYHESDYLSDPLMIPQQSPHKFKITNKTNGDNLTSVLMITNAELSDAGLYWLRVLDNKSTECSTMNSTIMVFLSIVPNGMYLCMCMYAYALIMTILFVIRSCGKISHV